MKVLNAPIDMIAVHDKTGDIRPIRFRIQEDEEDRVIKIDKIVNKNTDRIAGKEYRKFTCMVVINSVQKSCELSFEVKSMQWRLLRI